MPKKILEEIVEIPAITLEKGVEISEKVEKTVVNKKPFKIAEEYWETLGPGLTTGAADDDPSGIATYSQTGAQYGFQLLWLAAFTFPLMAIVQEMCARIGIVTGRGLAANIKRYFPKWSLYTVASLLFFANTFNLGADLGVMARATELIFPKLGFVFTVIGFALLSLLLQIFTTYARYAKYLKYLALVLFSYVFSAISLHLNWGEVLRHGLIPSLKFSKEQIFLVCAILGTTISPYLFFWQTSQEVEEEILQGRKTVKMRREKTSKKEVKKMRTDVWSGMFVSNIAMFFIITASAGALFAHGITNISTAEQAALALKPFAGELAYLLFTIGIVGVGMLSIPTLAGSASYALSESFGWKCGLYKKLKGAYDFYGVIIIAMLVGLAINFIHLDPIKALIYSAVANGIIAPVVLFFIIKISSNKKIMGKHASGPVTKSLGWLITGIMAAAGIAAIAGLIF